MNRRLIGTSVFVVMTLLISGQVTYGVKAGPRIVKLGEESSFIDGASTKSELRTSLRIGVFASQKIKNQIGATIELSYENLGSGLAENIIQYDKTQFNYLILTLMADFHLSEKIQFSIGPFAGLLHSLRFCRNDGGTRFTKEFETQSSKSVKDRNPNLGLEGSLIYHFNDRWGIDMRLHYGLKEILNKVIIDNEGNQRGIAGASTQGLFLTAVYSINQEVK